MAEEEKPKEKRGGPRGGGRPRTAFTHLREQALSDALIWYKAPEITAALILHGLNGNPMILKHLDERLSGRVGDIQPILQRLDEIKAALPEDLDIAAEFERLQAVLVGTGWTGEWTTAEAQRAGREGIEFLRRMAKRGDKESASIIARLYPLDPMLSIPERTQTMTPEEARELMVQRYTAAWPWIDRAEAERMVDALRERRTVAEE